MVNFSFIPPALAGIAGLLLIASFIIKPLKGFRVAVTGWAGKYAVLVAIAFIVIFLALAGGSIWLGDQWSNIAGGTVLGTASIGEVSANAITSIDCSFNAPTYVGAIQQSGIGITFVADPNDLAHYNAYVIHNNGTNSINGTLSCVREGDINLAGRAKCYVKAGSFRSETSTTDANVYYILATTAGASKVAGFPWAQTAYLNDGAVATTSSEREMTELVFVGGASAQATETLGYYFTLLGQTNFNYLNNQTANDVKIFCDVNGADKQVARLSVIKTTA